MLCWNLFLPAKCQHQKIKGMQQCFYVHHYLSKEVASQFLLMVVIRLVNYNNNINDTNNNARHHYYCCQAFNYINNKLMSCSFCFGEVVDSYLLFLFS